MEAEELEALKKRLTGKLVKARENWSTYFEVGIVFKVDPCCTYDNGGTDMARVWMDKDGVGQIVCDSEDYTYTVWGEQEPEEDS